MGPRPTKLPTPYPRAPKDRAEYEAHQAHIVAWMGRNAAMGAWDRAVSECFRELKADCRLVAIEHHGAGRIAA